MAKEIGYEDIVKAIRNKDFRPVYYLMGEEDYYIDRIADYLVDSVLTESEREFNDTVRYGPEVEGAAVINAARRYPMMSMYQVELVKEAQGLRGLENLSFYLQKPLESTILVFCHKHGTLDRRKKVAAE